MTFNTKNIWVLVLFAALGCASYVLGSCGVTRACDVYAILNPYAFTVFEPILLYSITTTPLGFLLLFIRDDVFSRWLRFAHWWVPLSVLLIVTASRGGNNFMPLYPDPTKENLALLMGGLFALISFILIFKTLRTNAKSKLPKNN